MLNGGGERSDRAEDHLPRRGPRAAEPRASGPEGFGPEADSVAVWSEATETKEKGTANRAFEYFSIAYFDCAARGSGATLFAAMFLGVDMYPLTAFLSAALTTTSNRLRSRPV